MDINNTAEGLGVTNEVLEQFEFLALQLSLSLLAGSLLLSYFVERRFPGSWFPEAAIFLLIGMAVGGAIKLLDNSTVGKGVERFTAFDTNLFFVVLLPPIIFNSGYQMRRDVFFRNFGTICSFAFVGTLVSSLVVGGIVYAASSSGFVFEMSGMDCLVFGSLISATDPVTVLVVFQRLGVDPDLYSLVFGESVLNDAVAIVLYRTFVGFEMDEDGVTVGAIFTGIGTFLGIFIGSFSIGVIYGVLSSLFFKYVNFGQTHGSRGLERVFVLLVPYMPYCLAEGIGSSGIVSILFCGMTMASYTLPNLSEDTRQFSLDTWSTVAHSSEAFVFIYLGMALFTADEEWNGTIGFTVVAVAAVLVGRFANVYPIAYAVNAAHTRRSDRWLRRAAASAGNTAQRSDRPRISSKAQFALWFSGLRGGIAFALSTSAEEDLDNDEVGRVMETATIILTCVTVFICGTGISPLVRMLGLLDPEPCPRAGSEGIELTDIGDHSDSRNASVASEEDISSSEGTPPMLSQSPDRHAHGSSFSQLALAATVGDSSAFARLDRLYIRPFLCVPEPVRPARRASDRDAEGARLLSTSTGSVESGFEVVALPNTPSPTEAQSSISATPFNKL